MVTRNINEIHDMVTCSMKNDEDDLAEAANAASVMKSHSKQLSQTPKR